MTLTPLLVARSQLLTAVDLFFQDKDPVSVQSLAGNSREVLESLCRLRGIEPMADLILQDHPGRNIRWLYSVINLYRNCFKHLGTTLEERDRDLATLKQFNDVVNDYLLYVCVEDYVRLNGAMPIPLQVFHTWFCAVHSDKIYNDEEAAKFLKVFPGISSMTRAQQKHVGSNALRTHENDVGLMIDPRTEQLN